MKQILSIQSSVAYGHVGNSTAVFVLQRMGHEVCQVDTLQFSNHVNYPQYTGDVFSYQHVASILQGLEQLDLHAALDAVLSGYLGNGDTGVLIEQTVQKIKSANPQSIYLCDPVIGDEGVGVYVADNVPPFYHPQVLALADIITPNQFEFTYLLQQNCDIEAKIETYQDVISLAKRLKPEGIVIVTSIDCAQTQSGMLDIIAINDDNAWIGSVPKIDHIFYGAGDAFSSLFLAYYLCQANVALALEDTIASMYSVIEHTHQMQAKELQLIAAQDFMVQPKKRFSVRPLSG